MFAPTGDDGDFIGKVSDGDGERFFARTGEEGAFPETLAVFPKDPIESAARSLQGYLFLALPVLALVLQDLTA